MSFDINAFRPMSAKADGASLPSVQGDPLTSTSAQRLRSSDQLETFKAATTAFLDSFKARYGAGLGQTARNTLREYAEMGRPLSASAVSQLATFADKLDKDNMGGERCIKVGDRTIDLGRIGLDKTSRVGSGAATKVAKA